MKESAVTCILTKDGGSMAALFSCFDLGFVDPCVLLSLKFKINFCLFRFIYIVTDNAVLGAAIKTTQENMFFSL